MDREKYNCYIDESGCEGFDFQKGASPWFVLSAIIVKNSEDKGVGDAVDEFVYAYYKKKGRVQPKNGIHWVNLNHKL